MPGDMVTLDKPASTIAGGMELTLQGGATPIRVLTSSRRKKPVQNVAMALHYQEAKSEILPEIETVFDRVIHRLDQVGTALTGRA